MENFYKPKIIKYIRSYRVRLLPTKEQEKLLIKMDGACRFIWNTCLEYCIMHYDSNSLIIKKGNVIKSINEFGKLLTKLKNIEEYKWLNDVSRHSLSIKYNRDLKKDFEVYFKLQINKDSKIRYSVNKSDRKCHPKFKSKKNNNDISIPFDADNIYYDGNKIQFPKLGRISIQTDIDIPIGSAQNAKNHKNYILNPRIKFINNKWILCFAMECENQAPILNNKEIVGIDLGLKDLCAATHYDSNNDQMCIIYHNINKVNARVKSLDKRLNDLQQKLSCKYRTFKRLHPNQKFKRSKSFEKLKKKIRKVYFRLTCIRKNYLHHVSKNIISRLPRAIVLEDLNFMIKNHKQAKSESNQMLGAFRDMICYKAQEKGIEIIWAPKNYPSSKMCSNCYNVKKELKLSERIYKCDVCEFEINRDINAAINLEKYGIFNAYAFTLNECNKC